MKKRKRKEYVTLNYITRLLYLTACDVRMEKLVNTSQINMGGKKLDACKEMNWMRNKK